MINLLPLEEKNEIMIKKKSKLILIFELGILLFLISILFIIFSISIYLNGEINLERTTVLQKEEDIDLITIADFQKEIDVLNEKMKNVESFYNCGYIKPLVCYRKQIYLTPILEKVFEKLPNNSYLNNISFTKNSGTLQVNLSGFAMNREDLLVFKRNIENDKDFKNVNFPPRNWVFPTNIEFSLSFDLSEND